MIFFINNQDLTSNFSSSKMMVLHIFTTKSSASSSSTFSTNLRISLGVSLPAIFFKIREIKVCSSNPIYSIDFYTSQGLNLVSIKLDFSNKFQSISNLNNSSLRLGILLIIISKVYFWSSVILVELSFLINFLFLSSSSSSNYY